MFQKYFSKLKIVLILWYNRGACRELTGDPLDDVTERQRHVRNKSNSIELVIQI